MDTAPEDAPVPLPPGLRALQRLVTVLTLVMILGFLVLIGALVMRLNARGPEIPASLDLPEGARATAVTQGRDWVGLVADEDGQEVILIYDRLTGRLRQRVALE